MKVLNVHSRIIRQPKGKVSKLLESLATKNDRIWPKENWPKMKFKEGIKIGAKGGHGPIRYVVEKCNLTEIIQFRFLSPKGFDGIHKFEIIELDKQSTEVKHTIDMKTSAKGTVLWLFAIRSLHNALIEDAFDRVENNFSNTTKTSSWNIWVRFLRKILN